MQTLIKLFLPLIAFLRIVKTNINIFIVKEEGFMQEAILLSKKLMDNNEVGPFGFIIVKVKVIIGRGNN